jgi:hypothetical protein
MTHMSPEQAETNLRLGKPLEQWLERRPTSTETVLRWARAEKQTGHEYVVSLYEAIESERARHDLYGLYATEPDEDGCPQQVFGAGKEFHCGSAEAAIAKVVEIGGSPHRFVNDGFVQDEYRRLVSE